MPKTLQIALLFALAACAYGGEVDDLAKQWIGLRDATLKTAEAMPESKYDFRPTEHDNSFAERLVNMAKKIDEDFAAISHQPSPFAMPDSLDAATVKKLVGAAFDFGAKAIDSAKDSLDTARAPILAAMSDASEGRGEAQAYIVARNMVTPEEADRRKFLFYGFFAAWLLVCLYVVAIAMRERRLRGELDRVKRLVENRDQDKAAQARP